METKELMVKFSADISDMKSQMSKLNANVSNSLKQTESRTSKFGGTMKKIIGGLGAVFATAKITDFAKQCVDDYQTAEIAVTKLTTVMKQRMGATDKQIKSVMDLTSKEQELGVVEDDAQKAGAQQVATYLKQTSSLKKILPAMNDLAVQQNGVNVTSENMVQIGNMVGKVFTGQVGALKRVGISFSKAQEEVLKTGTEEEKVAMLSKIITQNVGHMNKAMAKTDSGKIQQAKNDIGDMREAIGKKLLPVMATFYSAGRSMFGVLNTYIVPAIAKVIQGLSNFVGLLKQNKATIGIVIGAISALAIAMLAQVGANKLMETSFIKAMIAEKLKTGATYAHIIATKLATVATNGLNAALTLLTGPIGLAVLAITGFVTGIILAYKHSETFRNLIAKLKDGLLVAWNAIKQGALVLKQNLANMWNGLVEKATPFVNIVKTYLIGAFNILKSKVVEVKNSFTNMWAGVVEKATPIVMFVKGGLITTFNLLKTTVTMVKNVLVGAWNGVVENATPIVNCIKVNLVGAFGLLKMAVGGIIGVFKSLFNTFKPVRDFIVGALKGAFDSFKNSLGGTSTILNALETAFNFVKGAINRFDQAFIQATGGIQGLINKISPFVNGILTKLNQGITYARTQFGKFYETCSNVWKAMQPLVVMIRDNLLTSLKSMKGPLQTIWNSLKTMGTALMDAFKGVWTVLKPVLGALLQIGKVIGGTLLTVLKGAFLVAWQAIKGVFNALKPVLKTMAIIFGVTLVVALGVLTGIINGIAKALSGIVKAISGVFQVVANVFKLIVGVFTGDSEKCKSAIKGIGSGVKKVFSGLWGAVKGFVSGFFKGVIQYFKSLLSGIGVKMSEIKAKIKAGWQTVKDNTIGKVKGMVTGVKNKWNELKSNTSKKWGEIKSSVSSKMESAKKTVNSKASSIKSTVSKKWSEIKSDTSSKWQSIKSTIGSKMESAKKTTNSKASSIKSTTSKKWGEIKNNTSSRWQSIKSTIGSKMQGAWKLVSSKSGGMKSTLSKGWSSIKSTSGSKWETIKNTIKKKFDGIVGGAKKLPTRIKNAFVNGASKIKSGIKSMLNGGIKKMESGLNSLISGANSLWSKFGGKKNKFSKISIPKFAKGVNNYSGGLAMVGERGRELVSDPNLGTFMANNATVLPLSKGASVLRNSKTEKLIKSMGIPFYAKGKNEGILSKAKNFVSNSWDSIVGKGKDVFDYMTDKFDIKGIIKDFFKKLNFPSIPTPFSSLFSGLKNKFFSSDALTSWLKSIYNKFGGSIANVKGGGKAWTKHIKRAAKFFGDELTDNELKRVIRQINVESGGNAKAIQSMAVDDINSRTGNLARGLLQYVPSTFKAYAVKGHKNINNGYDQLLAFFNNSTWRKALPQLNEKRGWSPHGSRRKAGNGFLANKETDLTIGEKGLEAVVPLSNERALKPFGASVANALVDKTSNANQQSNENVTYTFTIPVMIDGREVAKATATFTKEELDKMETRTNRRNGNR